MSSGEWGALPEAIGDRIRSGVPLRLDLGCGSGKKDGHLGIDVLPLPGVDFVSPLPSGLRAFPDGCASRVFTAHFLEHVEDFAGTLEQVSRILRDDGEFEVVVPHFSNPYGHSDYTHRRLFGLYTMSYFVEPDRQTGRKVPVYGPGPRFLVRSVRLVFRNGRGRRRLLDRLVEWIVNRGDRTRSIFEGRFSWIYPCAEIRWRLGVDRGIDRES